MQLRLTTIYPFLLFLWIILCKNAGVKPAFFLFALHYPLSAPDFLTFILPSFTLNTYQNGTTNILQRQRFYRGDIFKVEILIYTQNAQLYQFIKSSIESSLYYRLGSLFSLHPAHPCTPAELIPLFRAGTSYLVFLDIGNNAAMPKLLSALHSKLCSAAFFLFSEDERSLLTAMRQQFRIVGFSNSVSESSLVLKNKLTNLLFFLASGLQNAVRGIFVPDDDGGRSCISYDSIYSILIEQKRSHYCLIQHENGDSFIRSSIQAMQKSLDYRFSRCSSSCIVNLQHIQKIDLSEWKLLLTNGQWCYITASYRRWFKYISGNKMPLCFPDTIPFFPY